MPKTENVEKEIKVASFDKLRSVLSEYGFELVEKGVYRDVYFGPLEVNGRRLRLRRKELEYPKQMIRSEVDRKTTSIEKGLQTESESITEVDFRDQYETFRNEYGEPVVDATLDVEVYSSDGTVVSLRNIREYFKYVEVEAQDEQTVNETIELLSIKGELFEKGAISEFLNTQK